MTIGISKERLLKKLVYVPIGISDYDRGRNAVLNELLIECTELNPWLPIDENTPKDRSVLLYSPVMENGCKQFVGNIESAWYWKPTHYQELPGDPK